MAFEARRRPRVVLLGPPTLSGRRSSEPLVVLAGGNDGGGNFQDFTNRIAAECNPGMFLPCGCRRQNGCGCNQGGSPGNGGNAQQNANQGNAGGMNDYSRCLRARWVPVTVTNPLVAAALGTATATFAPQANFILRRVTLSSAQAADFRNITIQVGAVQNILPGVVDGTYFDIAGNQDGVGRVDAPLATPGQLIIFNFQSVAGVAAGAARVTMEGNYAGQLGPQY
jgi:hypothetical protein